MNISRYKKVLSKYATGITVITKKSKNSLITGITVNSFVSISLKPAYISWSLDKTTSSYKKFYNLKFFNIYFLSEKQTNVSNYFSSRNEIQKNSIIVKNLLKNKYTATTNANDTHNHHAISYRFYSHTIIEDVWS